MKICSIHIKNFRALEDIDTKFDSKVNVIIGPNAIGKTTILEAIRLSKAVLSPRTPQESTQALFTLGAASPHLPHIINTGALLRNQEKTASIKIEYELNDEEIDWLNINIEPTCRSIIQARHGQTFSNPTVLLSYLASPQGINELSQISELAKSNLAKIKNNNNRATSALSIDPKTGLNSQDDTLLPAMISMLEQRLPPNISAFSYFPADRALPQGEQPIQIGGADAQQQLESHNSQPQLKYARLKTTIFNTLVLSGGKDNLQNDFELIFKGILKGRKIKGFGINQVGLVSIQIEDTESGKTFEIDAMSSGEKGLILTSLLIQKSLVNGGIILLDEPELHLNPAVCKDLLNFLINTYVKPNNLQLIVCSHSPEILSSALEHEDCALYHLESQSVITKVRPHDQDVISDCLRKLGTSEIEGLLHKGTVFVEGPDDIALIEAGYSEVLRRYKQKDLGGRTEIEKQIQTLQKAEKDGTKIPFHIFIFDRDDAPTSLTSSENVKIVQWKRRCFENYLIDFDVLSDILMDEEYVKNKQSSPGAIQRLLKDLASKQLDEIAIRDVYKSLNYQSPGMRKDDITDGSIEVTANNLFNRIKSVSEQFKGLDEQTWKSKFIADCEAKKSKLEETWDSRWPFDCDGKRLITDLHNHVQPRPGGLKKFKKLIMREMKYKSSENWMAAKSLIESAINK